MKRFWEIRKEKDEIEALIQRVADYMEFVGPAEEELSVEDLDLASAAGPESRYEQFLRKMSKK